MPDHVEHDAYRSDPGEQLDSVSTYDVDSSPSSHRSIQSAPATLEEAGDILYDQFDSDFSLHTTGQPYSLPEPHRWKDMSKWKWKNILRRQPLSTLQPGAWYAGQATRPLLLTFDAFDTLFTPREPIAKQYRDVASEWNLDIPEDAIMQSFKRAFKAMNEKHPNYGKETDMDPPTWWTRLIHDTLTPLLPSSQPDLPPDLPSALYTRFSSSSGYTLFPDVLPFLSLLGSSSHSAGIWSPRRTMLGIISNSDPRVHSILSSFGINISPSLYPPRYTPHSRFSKRHHDFGPAHFAFATLSYDAGFAKPDRRIFDAAARDAQKALDEMHPVGRLTRTGGEVLKDVHGSFHHMHIGDDLEKDVLPALECGWDAILLDRSAEQEIDTRDVNGKQVTVINSLLALRTVVSKERLERDGGQRPVWIDAEGRGPIAQEKLKGKYFRRGTSLKGRNLVEHPLSSRTRRFASLV